MKGLITHKRVVVLSFSEISGGMNTQSCWSPRGAAFLAVVLIAPQLIAPQLIAQSPSNKPSPTEQLRALNLWTNDPVTVDMLALLKEQAIDILLTTTRVPRNEWDSVQREQDKGTVKGLLEIHTIIADVRNRLEDEIHGGPTSDEPDIPLSESIPRDLLNLTESFNPL